MAKGKSEGKGKIGMKERRKRGPSKEPIMTLSKLAAEAGIAHWKCSNCGGVHDGINAAKYLFELIVKKALEGFRVQIRGFGTFRVTILKGRTIVSPISPSGSVESKDRNVLRFTQAPQLRKTVNKKEKKVKSSKKK